MRRIAIVTPCILPVPATLGGAVEELITRIIKDNEKQNDYLIDLFSVRDDSEDDSIFSKTHVISIEYKNGLRLADRILDKLQRSVKGSEGYRLFDKDIAVAFKERLLDLDEPYEAVIVENQVSIAKRIVACCLGRYEFPVFFHMHNDVDIYRSPEGLKELAACGVQFIAVSNYIKSQILKCTDAVVHVLYDGIEIREDITVENARPSADEDSIRFLYAGRVIPEKGLIELIRAFEKLSEMSAKGNGQKFTLDIIGFSNSLTQYEKRVIALAEQHKDTITCIKRMPSDKLNRQYDNYDIVVMPTLIEEAFGVVALETLEKGLPLITTDSGGVPEVVGDSAIIVVRSEKLVSDLAAAMYRLSTDKGYRKELEIKAFNRARMIPEYNIRNYYSNFIRTVDKEADEKISVIVPVYNVSDYLERCVNSLIWQSYSNIEILLVDDGSTDDSGVMCDSFAKKDSRIRVIHQENRGLSGARNTGIEAATGDLFFFCDSDDFLKEDALEVLIRKMHRDSADIVGCGFSYVWDDYEMSGREEIVTDHNPGVWNGKRAVIEMMRGNSICTVTWNKLYKKELFSDIRFPEGMLHEDEDTTYKLLYASKIVSYTPKALYKYYQRTGGIMGGNLAERYSFLLDILDKRIQYFKAKGEKELSQHSTISLLENIKYYYRNISDDRIKKELVRKYEENISISAAPVVMGIKKKLSLLLWKYIRY